MWIWAVGSTIVNSLINLINQINLQKLVFIFYINFKSGTGSNGIIINALFARVVLRSSIGAARDVRFDDFLWKINKFNMLEESNVSFVEQFIKKIYRLRRVRPSNKRRFLGCKNHDSQGTIQKLETIDFGVELVIWPVRIELYIWGRCDLDNIDSLFFWISWCLSTKNTKKINWAFLNKFTANEQPNYSQ